MLTVPRDHPDYPWHHKPCDHNVAGLFVDGPQPALPLTAHAASGKNRERAPSPNAAHETMQQKRRKAVGKARELERFIAAFQGRRIRNRRAA